MILIFVLGYIIFDIKAFSLLRKILAKIIILYFKLVNLNISTFLI